MSNDNPVREKAYTLAIEIVGIAKLLQERKEYVMSKQVLRSGTSIGANIEEALQAQSTADFISKMSIAHKESFETNYWLRLLIDTDYLSSRHIEKAQSLLKEVMALLTAILKKTKEKEQH